MDVAIVDCGIGNIKSVQRMFQAADADVAVIDDPARLPDCPRLILPGVGAFDAGMKALQQGWIEPLNMMVLERRVPILGICLGMQLLCRKSEEGVEAGLQWIDADVVRLDTAGNTKLKIPHMGWSVVTPVKANALLPDDEGEQRFYHVHKYRAVCDHESDILATAEYGSTFTTALQHDNIHGMQFHPEKSHKFGLAVFRRFAALPC